MSDSAKPEDHRFQSPKITDLTTRDACRAIPAQRSRAAIQSERNKPVQSFAELDLIEPIQRAVRAEN